VRSCCNFRTWLFANERKHGWAGTNEVHWLSPYQQAGPATGLPTRHEQRRLVIYALNTQDMEEFPKIVFCFWNIEESFYDTIKAFNYLKNISCRSSAQRWTKPLANSPNDIIRPVYKDYAEQEDNCIESVIIDRDDIYCLYLKFKLTESPILMHTPWS